MKSHLISFAAAVLVACLFGHFSASDLVAQIAPGTDGTNVKHVACIRMYRGEEIKLDFYHQRNKAWHLVVGERTTTLREISRDKDTVVVAGPRGGKWKLDLFQKVFFRGGKEVGKIASATYESQNDNALLKTKPVLPEFKLPKGLTWSESAGVIEEQKIIGAQSTFHRFNPRELIIPTPNPLGYIGRAKVNNEWVPAFADTEKKKFICFANGVVRQVQEADFQFLTDANRSHRWSHHYVSRIREDAKPIFEFSFEGKKVQAYPVLIVASSKSGPELDLGGFKGSDRTVIKRMGITWKGLNGCYVIGNPIGGKKLVPVKELSTDILTFK